MLYKIYNKIKNEKFVKNNRKYVIIYFRKSIKKSRKSINLINFNNQLLNIVFNELLEETTNINEVNAKELEFLYKDICKYFNYNLEIKDFDSIIIKEI